MSERLPQVTVIGSSVADSGQLRIAETVGRIVAGLPAVLVTGGRGGVMEAAAKGARELGGTTVAILPGDDLDDANPYNTIIVPTGIGHARNLPNVLSGDAVVVVGGEAGTLSELAFAWRFGRPIIAWTAAGGVGAAYAGKRLDNRREGCIISVEDDEGLRCALKQVLLAFYT